MVIAVLHARPTSAGVWCGVTSRSGMKFADFTPELEQQAAPENRQCQKEAELFRLRVSSWLSGANVLLNFAGVLHTSLTVTCVISIVISATCSYGSWNCQLVPCEKRWAQFASVFWKNLFIQSEANPRWCWKATSHSYDTARPPRPWPLPLQIVAISARQYTLTHIIHGAGIFTYIWSFSMVKYWKCR